MVSQQFRAHDQVRSNELSLRPQIALLEKEPPVTFADQARRPWFRRPRRIKFFLQEKCELIRIGEWNHLHIPTLVH